MKTESSSCESSDTSNQRKPPTRTPPPRPMSTPNKSFQNFQNVYFFFPVFFFFGARFFFSLFLCFFLFYFFYARDCENQIQIRHLESGRVLVDPKTCLGPKVNRPGADPRGYPLRAVTKRRQPAGLWQLLFFFLRRTTVETVLVFFNDAGIVLVSVLCHLISVCGCARGTSFPPDFSLCQKNFFVVAHHPLSLLANVQTSTKNVLLLHF